MCQSIVCGVDGSDESVAAAAHAARLCERLGAALVLAHAVQSWTAFSDADEAQLSRYRRRVQAEMTRTFERIERRFSRLEISTRVLTGAPAQELTKLAAEENAALLVVGSRGRGRVQAALLGSVSSAVARASDRPVVIVPPYAVEDADVEALERSVIVCGVDHSEDGRNAARVAAQLALDLRLELVLVHVYASEPSAAAIPAPGAAPSIAYEDRGARRREAARELLEQVATKVAPEVTVRMRIEGGDPPFALGRCAEAENAELIVVGMQGRGAVASMLLGSTFSRLAASASRPLVVVPAGASLQPARRSHLRRSTVNGVERGNHGTLALPKTGLAPQRTFRRCQGCFYEVKGTSARRLKRSREMWRLSARMASRLVFPSLMRRWR